MAFCFFCQASTGHSTGVCEACLEAMPRIKSACPMCGIAVAAEAACYCAECLQAPKPFQHSVIPCDYSEPMNFLVPGLKFQGLLHHLPVMSFLLAEKVSAHYQGDRVLPEALLPVPLHAKRMRQRGFNQALELAKPLARQFKLPILSKAVTRVKATLAQSDLGVELRRQNILDAFQLTGVIDYQHVAIVDDVVTTTETVTAVARVLLEAGVQRVDVWALARVK
ncbi:MAG: ComF family protein [Methylococcales bacterium]|nr:ComF family protein [Methylococcales bacterium]MBT7445354.1 ComF family protein [Methylococcales bacterium]